MSILHNLCVCNPSDLTIKFNEIIFLKLNVFNITKYKHLKKFHSIQMKYCM
jgi:hypothetical protein